MTQMHDLTGKSLGLLLANHPRALKALEDSLERQAARGKLKAEQLAEEAERRGRCAHCGTKGKPYTVAGVEYRCKPENCCQQAIYDTAVNALKYAKNPLGDKQERVDMARKFKELEPQITDPILRMDLAAERKRLDQVKMRVIDSGRSPALQSQSEDN